MSTEAASAPTEAGYPAMGRAFWTMALLFFAANLYSIDKGIVGVLAEPIRTEFGIGDQEMGLLLGLAYSVLSGVLGLGLGWLIDHRTRKTLLAGAIALWSIATIACGLAPGFRTFFIARMLVGLGEAAIAPAAVSLIADLFAPRHRGRALSSYLIGASIGSGLSSAIPGWVLRSGLTLDLPLFGTIAPWRTAFVLCGAAGPVIAALFLTIPEPVRRGLSEPAQRSGASTGKVLRLWQHKALIAPLFAGFCMFYIALVGITSWTATFLGRRYGVPIAEFSGALGLMLLVTGISGYVISGFLADSRLSAGPRGRIFLLAVLPLLGLPAALASFAPDWLTAIVLLGTIGLAMPMINVATSTAVQDILPNDMRGFGYAALGLLSALTAGAGGPWLMALVAGSAGDGFGEAFALVGIPVLIASSLLFIIAGRASVAAHRKRK